MTIYTQSGEFDKEIKSIKELIAFFDNLAEKPLFLNFIGQNVKFWGKDNEEEAAKDEYKYEDLAFSLVENINIEAWNTRFGPINYIKHGDEVIIEKPEFKEITADAISYWEQRINEVTNPVIKLQYLGLVHTFKEKITGKKCSDTFLRDYVETIINASENNFELDLTSAQIHLPFAFEISKAYPDLLTKVKNEYLDQFNSEKRELLSTENKIDVSVFDIEDFGDIEIGIHDLNMLGFFIASIDSNVTE